MATIKISDLNPVTSLSDSEMSNISGGYWGEGIVNKISGGFKRAGQGIKDGSSNTNSRHDDLWYNLGYGGGKFLGS